MKPASRPHRAVLILGAGVYQRPLIAAARAMGLRTLVASRPGPYPGFALADRAFHVDTTDAEAVLAIARAERIEGICTTGTDVALPALGRVAEALGLPGPTAAAATRTTNKLLMRRACAPAGVRMPRFLAARDAEDAAGAAGELGWPVMLKATDSSGSRGIVRVDHAGQIAAAVAKVRAVTRREEFLVEEFVAGDDFGTEAFVHRGRLAFLLPTGNLMAHADAPVPVGHYLPNAPALAVIDDLRAQLQGAVQALGLDDCAINADLVLSRGRPYLIEMGARAGATCLPELAGIHGGFNYYRTMLRAALGEAPEFALSPGPACAAELIRAPSDGRLGALHSPRPPGGDVVEIAFDVRPGETVRAFRVGPDRIGHVIVRGPDVAAARATLAGVMEGLRIEVSP